MAVLNKIRQRSLILILIIALALFAFVIGDLFKSSDGFSAKSQNTVATINGKNIDRNTFLQKVEAAQRQSGPGATNTQVVNRVWNQEVRNAVMGTQFDKLGMSVEKNQMRDLLKGALSNSPEFLNESGVFDKNKLNEYIANLKETSPAGYQSWVAYEKSLASSGLQQNYFNMVKAGLVGTVAEGELEHNLLGNKVDLKLVQIPYTSIVDSTVAVSKSEISGYIKDHKDQFTVEASRDIKYVEFKETASVEDENTIKGQLTYLLKNREEYNATTKETETITGFVKASNSEAFVNANSDIKFDARFVFKSGLPKVAADAIYNLNIGETYGPYKDGAYYKLSKLVAVKQIPDSAKVRHILIPFLGARSAGPDVTKTEEQAKATADSLTKILKGNRSKFPEFVKSFSSDQGSVNKEGRYDWHPYNTMVPEFNAFEFEGKKGDLGVVKTAFGFHIIEIEGQKNKSKAVQVATIARKIEPSEATVDKVFRDASNFEINAGKKDFEEVAKASNYSVRPVNDIKILDENIPGVGSQRPIVRWAFNDDVSIGDTKRFTVPGGYAIVQLVAVNKAGLMNVEDASARVLPILRKEKKAEMIKSRISATTLEEVAKAENKTVKTLSAINMKNPTISGAGREPLVVGTAFGLAEGETSGLIAGEKGVFMLKVTKFTPAVKLDNYQAAANRIEKQKAAAVNSKLYNALKDASEIEDNRAKIQIQ